MKMEQKDVPKHLHIKFRRRGITQTKEYNKAEVVERLTMNSNKFLVQLVEVAKVYDLTLAN
jgi:hypothetical protein